MFCEEIEEWLQNSSSSGDELDSLLLEASDNYESMQRTDSTKRPQSLPEYTPPPLRTHVVPQPAPPPTLQPLPHQRPTATAERFAPPKTTAEIVRAREKVIPKIIQQDTIYCVNIWDEWRGRSTGIVIAPLQQLPPH